MRISGPIFLALLLAAIAVLGAMIDARKGATCPPDKECIRYMAWGTPEALAIEQDLVNRFNSANPDIHVGFFIVPGNAYGQKLTLMLASGTGPDVVRVDHYQFPSLAEKGYFADLTGFAEHDATFHRSDYLPIAYNESIFNGRWYGPNVLFGSMIMYYNKSLFKRAGLPDPYKLSQQGRWSWAAFREAAIKIARLSPPGPEPTVMGATVPGFPGVLLTVLAFGGNALSEDHKRCLLDSPEAIKAYQFWTDMTWQDRACPTPAQAANSAFAFETGKTGMSFDWMGQSPRLRRVISDFDWDVCPPPTDKGKFSNYVKGNQLVIPAASKHKEAAWRFAKFISSEPTETYLYCKLRRAFPTRKDVTTSAAFLHSDQPPTQIEGLVDAIKDSAPLPIDSRWAEWTRALNMESDNLTSGRERDARVVMRRAAKKVDQILSEAPGF